MCKIVAHRCGANQFVHCEQESPLWQAYVDNLSMEDPGMTVAAVAAYRQWWQHREHTPTIDAEDCCYV